MKTVLLIPVRNEVETIGALVTAALNFVDKIIVDEGGSTDGTMRALREIWQTLPDPSVLTIAGRPVGAPPLSWIINDKAWLGELMADGYFCLATMDAVEHMIRRICLDCRTILAVRGWLHSVHGILAQGVHLGTDEPSRMLQVV